MVWFRTFVSWVELWVFPVASETTEPRTPSQPGLNFSSVSWISFSVFSCSVSSQQGLAIAIETMNLVPIFCMAAISLLIPHFWSNQYDITAYISLYDYPRKCTIKWLVSYPHVLVITRKQPRTEKHAIPPSVNIRLLRLPSIGIPRHGLLMAGASETFFWRLRKGGDFLQGGETVDFQE